MSRRFSKQLALFTALSLLISACSREGPVRPASTCGGLVQEAEAGELFGAFQKTADVSGGNASGGSFITTVDATPISVDSPSQDHYAKYCVTISETAEYQLKTWVAGEAEAEDSFWILFNDETYYYSYKDIVTAKAEDAKPFPQFSEDYASHDDLIQVTDPLTFTLEKGEHELIFALRESDSRLDKFEFERLTN